MVLCVLSLGKWIQTGIHRYGFVQDCAAALKSLCAVPTDPSLPQPHGSYFGSVSLEKPDPHNGSCVSPKYGGITGRSIYEFSSTKIGYFSYWGIRREDREERRRLLPSWDLEEKPTRQINDANSQHPSLLKQNYLAGVLVAPAGADRCRGPC